MTKGSVFLSEI